MSKKILCFGGRGNLGTNFINSLTGYHLTSVDLIPAVQSSVHNIIVEGKDPHQDTLSIKKSIGNTLFDAILVASGGWKGGNIKADSFIEDYQHMNRVNFLPSLIAAHIATRNLAQNGMILFTGANAAFEAPQPEMLGYALAKTAVHSLALNLSQQLP